MRLFSFYMRSKELVVDAITRVAIFGFLASLFLNGGYANAVAISNTASATFLSPAGVVVEASNTVSYSLIPMPVAGSLEFLRFAPEDAGAMSVSFASGLYDSSGSGAYSALPAPVGLDGIPIDLSQPVPVSPMSAIHAGEPVFLRITDSNRNVDPAVVEYVNVNVRTSTGGLEIVRLVETAANSGVFVAVIQAVDSMPASPPYSGVLTVGINASLEFEYQDPFYPDDSSSIVLLADPFGYVFDSVTGAPLNGALVSLVDATTGAAATVYGDDEVSAFPSSLQTGSSVQDGGGATYAMSPGAFRFPFVPAGTYKLVVIPPEGYLSPSTVALSNMPLDQAGNHYNVGSGARGEAFSLMQGSTLAVDIPVDSKISKLHLELLGSRAEASAGDFVQYRLVLRNLYSISIGALEIASTLPSGMRYRSASVRVNGQQSAEPDISADGKTLTFRGVSNLGAGDAVEISYVVQLGAGISLGEATGTARATTDSGLLSNLATSRINVREAFFSSHGTIIGSIFEGDCTSNWESQRGVANVRLVMDNGVYVVSDKNGQFHFNGVTPGTHVVQLDVDSLPAGFEPVSCGDNTRFAGRAYSQFVDAGPGMLWRADFYVKKSERTEPLQDGPAPALGGSPNELHHDVDGDAKAAGAEEDWLAGHLPGVKWLFPGVDYNPRSPATRIVIMHQPGHVVMLRYADGTAVDDLAFDGVIYSESRKVAASVWRGVSLKEGPNTFSAEVQDANGALVQKLTRTVHYANRPVRAELVSDRSLLVADGIRRPVIAVRLLDHEGRPVRSGVSGPYRINSPYRSWQAVEKEQDRQLAGLDRFDPQFRVEGDDGIALIELAPTTDSGMVQIDVSFQLGDNSFRRQELRAWLEPQARDWIIVGFAEGTVGYSTLKEKGEAPAGNSAEGRYSDGQVSLYAKGRVLGKWVLTMAYDSDKQRDDKSLLGVIKPNEYYTLYGDSAEQRHDAASQDKLYLKLERGQFYALFGDYESGMSQTQLSRYSRTLNGLKVEKAGGVVQFTAFASEIPQNFARDEVQGNGTSGLYRLSQRNIVLNSEKVRIETRNRLRSEKIIESKSLTRYIDYDIDYSNGTLFFRQPVQSRNVGFNPTFIVAEYETLGVASESLNAGGRVGLSLSEGRVQVGVSGIRDQESVVRTDLAGADIKVKVGRDSELRAEAAQTDDKMAALSPQSVAWLTEFEHHSGRLDALIYVRRQEVGFGLRQQNASESGQQKIGAEGQLRLAPNWSVTGQLFEQQNLATDSTRDSAQAKVQYKGSNGGFNIGVQATQDGTDTGALAGKQVRSEQLTAGANRLFFDRKLELFTQAESALGGDSASVDYPDRYLVGANYALTSSARLLVAQELTDGSAFDTSTTRVGTQVVPWKGARLDTTLNQSQISEFGSRTFGLLGMTQGVVLSDRWGIDLSVDSSQTLQEPTSPAPLLVINPAYPVAPGGTLGGIGLTEDFVAVSTGATYRAPLWSWNGRAEDRRGEASDRYGIVSHFLRQAQAGVAFASSAQLFRSEQSSGSDAVLGSLDLSWAARPLGSQWSILDRLELRYEKVVNGVGTPGSGVFGHSGLDAANAESRRLVNNLALNRVSREWDESDRQGNLFRRYERSQLSLYYGAKYVVDTFDGVSYSGYSDIMGLAARRDLSSWLDVGVQASALNGWSTRTHAYSYGVMVGASPVENGWVTLGWNQRGFSDGDFDAARYTAQGPYLQLRFKFDQRSRPFGVDPVARRVDVTSGK